MVPGSSSPVTPGAGRQRAPWRPASGVAARRKRAASTGLARLGWCCPASPLLSSGPASRAGWFLLPDEPPREEPRGVAAGRNRADLMASR
ncbi:hypothetical protein E2320_013235 [Naja naja]|nr:hypothetical protein E2320_013235 [Naja naja]